MPVAAPAIAIRMTEPARCSRVLAGIGDQAQEFVHAATFRRDKRFDDLRRERR